MLRPKPKLHEGPLQLRESVFSIADWNIEPTRDLSTKDYTETHTSWTIDLRPAAVDGASAEEEARHASVAEKLHTEPNTVATEVLLSYICEKENLLRHLSVDDAYKLYSEIKRREVSRKLRLVDWHRLFQRLFGHGSFTEPNPEGTSQRAIELLKDMRTLGTVPDAFIYACLYRAMKDDVNKADRIHKFVMDEMRGNNGLSISHSVVSDKSFRTLLAVYLHRADGHKLLGRARALWKDMAEAKIVPSVDTQLGFLEAFRTFSDKHPIDKKKIQIIHSIIKGQSVSKSTKVPQRVLDGLILSHDACQHPKAVAKLFEETKLKLIIPSFTAYKVYIRNIPDRPSTIIKMFGEMTSMKMPLDDECYNNVARAFAKMGDINGLITLHTRLRSAFRPAANAVSTSVSLKARAYQGIIDAYGQLGRWEEVLESYQEYKLVRQREYETYRESSGTSILSRAWRNTPLVPRSALRNVLLALGSHGRLEEARKFFMEEVLTLERLSHLWRLHVSGKEKRLRQKQAQLKKSLAAAKAGIIDAKGARLIHLKGLIPSLQKELAEVEAQAQSGLQLSVGMEGPLRVPYSGFTDGWRDMVERDVEPNKQAEELMRMEELLLAMYELENQRLKAALENAGVIDDEPALEDEAV
ncbi:hypothetical protein HDU85_006166 [Gaertneriomyces sp. JEL0708]|nr:hypothetical protein HDU85_006166 [Gaertneriomyces sp. JEL0708]